MSKPANQTMIGLFVVGAVILLVVAIGVLGTGKLFKDTNPYVMVFEGSVKGLNVGSPVVFRGVKIGSVSDIRMHFNYATKSLTIPVYAEFEQRQVKVGDLSEEIAEQLKNAGRHLIFREMIGHGLRAQLEMQSIVTGQLQIALDFYPEKEAVYTGIDETVQEIPTIPTPIQQLTRKLESLPLEEILYKINSAADGISNLVQSPELKESVANLNATLKDVKSLVHNMDAQVEPLSAGFSETIRDMQNLVKNTDAQAASMWTNLNETIGDSRKLVEKVDSSVDLGRIGLADMVNTATSAIKQAEKALEAFQSATKSDSFLMYRVTESLHEVEKSARSLRVLTDYLERHPEALFSGKGDAGEK